MFKLDENYQYVNKNVFYKIISAIIYFFLVPILYVYCKLIIGYKVLGKENLNHIRSGVIMISKENYTIKTIMLLLTLFPTQIYFVTSRYLIKNPIKRLFIRILGGIPVPTTRKALETFINDITFAIKNGKIVHFDSEVNGAYRLAIKENIPIVPIKFENISTKSLFKFIKRKPYLHLIISKPIYSSGDYNKLKDSISTKI